MRTFREYFEEMENRPVASLNQRPTFQGVSPDSLNQLWGEFKQVGASLRQYIQFTQANQPQTSQALTTLLTYLKGCNQLINTVNTTVQQEYQAGPWERQNSRSV